MQVAFSYPLESNSWFRLSSKALEQGHTYDAQGHWRCANCLEKWEWGVGGSKRIIITGSPEDVEIFVSFVGTIPDDLELQLGLLKAATLLKEVEGKTITKEVVMEGIKQLNERCSGRLGQMLPTRTCEAKDVTHVSTVPIYCEDPALSFEGPNLEYRAFKLPGGFGREQPLSRDGLELCIACAAGFFDLERVPAEGPRREKALPALMDARSKL